MNDLLIGAANDLTKRERPEIVAATGLFFAALRGLANESPLEGALLSYRGGIWGDEAPEGHGYPVLRSTNMRGTRANVTEAAWRIIRETQAQDYALETGDILVTKSSGSSDLVGKATLFIHPRDGKTYLFSNFTLRLRPNRKLVLPEFLAWFLRSPQSLLWRYESQQNAVGLRNLQTTEFLGQRIPVPPLDIQKNVVQYLDLLEAKNPSAAEVPLAPPLDEQRRIVARIEQLAAKIEEARRLRRQVVQEVEALWPSILTSAYDEAVGIAGKSERLDDLCQFVTDGTHITPRYVPEGIPFLSVKDITTGQIRFDDARFITREEHLILTKRCRPERGDVLLTKVGTTGFAKAVDVDREFSIFVSLALLRLDKQRLHAKFTEYMLNSSRLKEYSNAGTRGVGNQNLVLKFIRDFPMPAPLLPEQRRIVAYLDGLQAKVDVLKKLQAETAAELGALLPSILDRAFRAEL
jgi:restriction endonuclease S subunit